MPSCTIYNRSAFFQLHHNNAAWWRSEWFGDSTIGLLNVFAKKMSESKIKSTKHWTSRRRAWPKIFIDLLFDYSKNILLLTTTRSYCSSQPSMVQWLSSSIFPCLSSRYGNIRPNLHFFSIYTGIKALYYPSTPLNTMQYQVTLTQYHQVPTSTALYWPNSIIYISH